MKNDQLSSVLKQPVSDNFHALDQENQETLRKMLTEINQAKFNVGDIDLQLAVLEMKKTELIKKLHSDSTQLNSSINKLAQEIGIDLNDPAAGKWNIDLTAAEIGFKRVG